VTNTLQDEVLIEKAREGDEEAFLLLYERHRSTIFRFLYRLSGSAEVAEDITHDCFLSLIRGFGTSQIGRPPSLLNQLYSTARNLAMEYFRNSGQGSYDEALAKDDSSPGTEQPANWILDQATPSQVGEMIATLPPIEREVLIFTEYEGLELGEIAKIVSTDPETLKTRLKRAHQRLLSSLVNNRSVRSFD